jgi:hypothetical protein
MSADSSSVPGSKGPATERLLVFAAVAVGAFIIAFGPVSDGDIYWHLAAGREMVRQRMLLYADPFTVSAAGRTWIDVHWLFQLGAFAVHSAFGFAGLATAKALLVAGGAAILTWAAERSGGGGSRALAAVAILGGLILDRHLLPMRPVILTLLFLAAFLFVLEGIRTQAIRARWPWLLLPLLQVLWCNCQGLAPLGPALVAMYLASAWLSSRRFRHWPFAREEPSSIRLLVLMLALCVLASFATPYGIDGVLLPLRLLARITPASANIFSSAVAENIPPFVLRRTAPELVWHFAWVLVSLAVVLALLRPRFHLAHLLAFGAFLTLALMANRNMVLFYWIGAPLVAIALGPGLARLAELSRRHARLPMKHVGIALLAAEVALAVLLHAREPAAGSPTPFHFPVESARLLLQQHMAGPVFAADHHGGYLTFTCPSVRPYIDTRLVLHSGDEYAEYLGLFDSPERFDTLDSEANFVAVVLTTAYPDRYLGLIWHLARSSDWHLAYTDGYEVLFLRDGPRLALGERATVDAIVSESGARFGAGTELAEAARIHLARLLVVLGHSRQAQYVLSSLASRPAAELRARAHFAAGELRAAETLAHILLLQDPRDRRSLTLLAEIAAGRGQTDMAAAHLRQALAIDPYDPEARSLAERLRR